MKNDPSLLTVLRWLTGVTRPVHPPLYASTVFRILGLALQIGFYGAAGAGVVAVYRGASAMPVFAWLAAIAVLKAGLYYLEQFTGHYVAFKALELLRTTVFAMLWPKAPAVVAQSRSGDVLASLTRDVDRIEVVYAHTFAPVVSAFVVPPLVLVVIGYRHGWQLVAIPAICVFLSLLVVPWYGFRADLRAGDALLAARRRLSHHVTDSVFGAEEIMCYGRQEGRLAETGLLGDEVAAASIPARRHASWRRAGNMALMLTTTVSILWMGIALDLDAVWLAGLAAGSLRLFEGPRGIEDAAGYLDKSLAAARRLWQMAHAEAVVRDGMEELLLASAPEIRMEAVSYAYRNAQGVAGPLALEHVDITFPAGSHTLIVGPSGCGKTTAVHALQRYFDPDSGRVTLNGRPVGDFTLNSLRRAVVAVTQQTLLLDATIAENLRLGAPHASDEDLERVLRIAEFEEDLGTMPDGLETQVGQNGTRVSGGQAQRLGLARALLLRPMVLILDEFTAHLNNPLATAIRENVRREMKDVTLIEVTHRLDNELKVDQVVLLDRGKVLVAASGSDIDALDGGLLEFFRTAD